MFPNLFSEKSVTYTSRTYYMKLSSCLLFFALTSTTVYSQNWGTVSESAFVNEALDIETDVSGSSYVTGYITGETAFGNGLSFPTAQGNGDIYVAKYTNSGTLVWVRKFGGSFSDRAYDLTLDNNGNIFITGQFYGTVDFDGNSISSTANSKDIFLAKLDNNGTAIWAISEGGTGSENAYGVTCDNAGNVILTGQFEGNGTLTGQSFSSTVDPVTGLPSYDLFVSKYDSNGNPLWTQVGEAKYEDRGLAVTTDAQNNIYLSGQFSDTLTFAGSTFNNGAYNVGLLVKLSSNGNLVWLNTLKGSVCLPYDVEVNGSDLFVGGDFRGNLIYSNNNLPQYTNSLYDNSIFVLKTTLDGQQTWTSILGSDNDLSARSLSVTPGKETFITGYFSCAWTEFHQTQTAAYRSVGFKDAYLWKVNQNGSLSNVKTFGSKKDDLGHGVAIVNSNQAIICGGSTDDLNIPTATFGQYTINNNNYFNLNSSYVNEPGHVYLNGDNSRNAFITTAVTDQTLSYNYFTDQPNDSLVPQIFPYSDTIHICVGDSIYGRPETYSHFGPAYDYLWNTNQTTSSIYVNTSGDYDVTISRKDQCSFGSDSAFVLIHQLPNLPTMTDNLGLAIDEVGPLYYYYDFCHPDSVEIWFNNLDPSYTIEIISGPQVYADTLPHYYFADATIIVADQFCQDSGYFSINYDYVSTYDYDPYLTLVDEVDFNDSMVICQGTEVEVQNHDYTNNLNGTFYLMPDDTSVYEIWTVFFNNAPFPSIPVDYNNIPYDFGVVFEPVQTGFYTVQLEISIGYNNLCGLDTTNYIVVDTFYFEVLPNPVVSVPPILGDNLLCPNGSVYLTVDTTIVGFGWHGPGVIWTSSDVDSAQVTVAGDYMYGGTYTDTTTGCSSISNSYFSLTEKEPPTILLDPLDGIVCPYDTVLLYVDDIYLEYDWTGPSGSNLSSTYFHQDDDQGFYYVTVLDDEGCYLTSPPAELREYSTPYLTVEPSVVLCENETTTVSVVVFGDGVFNWVNPAGNTGTDLIVDQPGWYICEMTQCGITTMDSVEIIDGTFTISLSASDTLLCFGEDVLLTATAGLSDYEWSSGDIGVSSIFIENEGIYTVSASNNYGCQSTSNPVEISYVESSEPPQISDLVVCTQGNLLITNPTATNWYTSDSVLISSGNSINIDVQNDTTLLVSNAPSECPVVYSEIEIELIQEIPTYQVTGNTSLCYSENLELVVNSSDETLSWWHLGNTVGADTSVVLDSSVLTDGDTIILVLTNECYEDTLITVVQLFDQQMISVVEDSVVLCYNDDLELSIEESYDNVIWSGNFGTIQDTSLFLTSGFSSGYIYVQAIDSNGCFTNSDSVYVSVSYNPISIATDVGLNCFGDSVLLWVQTNNDSILWTTPFGAFSDTFLVVTLDDLTTGIYTVQVWDSLGCEYTDSIDLTTFPLPIIDLPGDTILCLNDYIDAMNGVDSLSFNWENYGFEDSVIITGSGWYYVTVTNNYGCVFEDSVYVVSVNCEDEIPNVITPNGDGVNDYFFIDEAPIFPNNRLTIVNRWGRKVFEEDGYNNSFNGDALNDGVYFYTFYRDYRQNPNVYQTGFLHIVR